MSEPCADGMCWSGPLCAIIDDLKVEIARLGNRLAIVTPYGPEWIAEHYPDWLVIDSDDGITMAGGTCYLLERLPEGQGK